MVRTLAVTFLGIKQTAQKFTPPPAVALLLPGVRGADGRGLQVDLPFEAVAVHTCSRFAPLPHKYTRLHLFCQTQRHSMVDFQLRWTTKLQPAT